MPTPNYNHNQPEEGAQYDLDNWIIPCRDCLKPISATRPPVFNPDNCSCSELGERAEESPLTVQSNTQDYEVETTTHEKSACQDEQSPLVYVSSSTQTSNYVDMNDSGAGNASYTTDATTTQTNSYATTKYFYPLVAYLKEPEHSIFPRTMPPSKTTASMEAKKGSNSGQSSLHSSRSVDAASGPQACDVDPTTGLGAWADAMGDEHEGVMEYPMVMSGLSDAIGK